ncbi:hypothetical protein GH714_022251 [Hevea brasiliensis]|uniref:Uncharacterized protein n=1 Tax=Hevea brasiliensis TaxID=3981 RepID=A0A6A6MK23_HEVBR|nr:hypothetical protein GH714_022251 [Hevea brasiliensis]
MATPSTGADYKGDLMTLGSDSDVVTMCKHAVEHFEVDIYIEHLTIEDLKREFQIDDSLPKQSSLVIEEIEEETVAQTHIPMQPLAKTIEHGECSWTTNHANLLCDREANVDSNIEIVNDVQCEASVSEHCVNEENSDGTVRAKEVNADDGFNEYIDALIGSERLDDYINPIMEDTMGNFGNNSQDVPLKK